jgi:ADP-heptose:LPS heptosyltransferase
VIERVKQPAFRALAAAERVVRAVTGGNPSLETGDLSRIRNFLIPQVHPYLGAAVHETPLIEALRSAVPDANIVAVGSGIGNAVLRKHPWVTSFELTPDPNRDFWAAVWTYRRIVRSFRGEPWGSIFAGWNGRSRVVLASMMAGKGVRAGFAVAPPLAHLPLIYNREKSQIANNLMLPGLFGWSNFDELEPRVFFDESDLNHARELLAFASERPTAVLITRTSGGQPTRWPADRFAAVAKYLVAMHGCRVVLPGTSRDAAELSELVDRIGEGARSLAGQTTISQLAAVCTLADIAVALDTGATHVARAQGLPLVIIAPAWQDSVEWMPLGKAWARILKGPWLAPPPPAGYALEEITVDDVNSAASELLNQFPPSRERRQQRAEKSLNQSIRPVIIAS